MKPEQTELVPAPGAQLATQEPSVGAMMQSIIQQGITADNVTAFERLVALKERMDDKQAEREFAVAFADLQTELPRIAARGKADRYSYMKYEDIMAEILPLLNKHGFSVTFSTKVEDARITQFCTVTHRNGHSRVNQYAVRLSNRTPGLNECQQDGLAGTYAKRYALCNAFNITVETDTDGTDARNEGAPITEDQALYLRELVRDTKSDEAAFLKFAGASKYEEIGAARYDQLAAVLHKKSRGA